MKLRHIALLNHVKHFVIILCTLKMINVKGIEICNDKYCLSTDGLVNNVNSLDYAEKMCQNKWLLEIHDESVKDLLSKLMLLVQMENYQHQGILLGMIEDKSGWIWSDTTKEISEISGQGNSFTYAATITRSKLVAREIKDSAAFICNKDVYPNKCDGWFHEGSCYHKSVSKHTTWYEAHNECIRNNSRLAIFKNFTSLWSSTFIDEQQYWIALSRKTKMWKHSNAVVTYNQWLNVSIVHDKSCAVAINRGTDWIPSDCQGYFTLVCMRENDQSSTTLPSASSKSPGSQACEPTASPTKACSKNSSISVGWMVGFVIGNSLAIALSIFAVVLLIKFWKSSKTLSSQRNSDNTSKPGSYNATVVMSRSNPTYVNVDHDSKISSEADKTVRRSETEKCGEVYETFDDPPVRE